MPYQTIVLRLLEQRPQVYDRLRRERMLLPALDPAEAASPVSPRREMGHQRRL